jgi:hypothetical protein
MEKRFCGIDIGGVLSGMRPIDDLRTVATYVLEEVLSGALPYHVLTDDGGPAARYCMLILGRLRSDIHFVSIDGSKGTRMAPDMPIDAIRRAIAALPDGRDGQGHLERVVASPYAAAGVLLVALTPAGAMNCAFARNPALEHDDAARLLKAYFAETLRSWTGKN